MTTIDKEYLDARLSDVRSAVEGKIGARFNALRAELHQTIAASVKWCAGIAATGPLRYTTMLAFLMNNAALPLKR